MRLALRTLLLLLGLVTLLNSLVAQATPQVRAVTAPVLTSAGTVVTISQPSGTIVGDLLIATVHVRSNTNIVAPAGWNTADTANGTNLRQAVYWRVATAAGTGSHTWTLDVAGQVRGGGMIAINAGTFDADTPFDAPVVSSTGNSKTPSTPLTVINSDVLVLAAFSSDKGNDHLVAVSPASNHYDVEFGTGVGLAALLSSATQAVPGNLDARASIAVNVNWIAQAWAIKPPGTAPVLSWRFEEATWTGAAGEVLDSSGNNLNGTAKAATATKPTTAATTPALASNGAGEGTCRYGSFTSANRQYVEVAAANLPDLSSFTVSVWVYPRSWPTSGLMSILSKDENFEFHLKPSGVVNWWWQDSDSAREFDSSNNAAGRVAINAWTHVAIRFRPGSQTLFINGVANASASNALAPLSNGDPLQIGADQGFAGRYFDGNLDEVRVFAGALSDAQVLALASERHPCAGAAPHHLELLHDGTALTCQPEAITLRACADAACSSLYTGTVTATLAPSGWVGGDTRTFSGGTASLQLRHSTAEVVVLGVGSASPTPSNPALCYIGVSANCSLDFKDTGFIFDVPNLLANKPSGSIDLIAARKDDSTQRCVPAFGPGTRTVQFWSGYGNPASGSQRVSVNNQPVSGSSPGTSLSLGFDANARASIDVHYADAGQMTLDARYTGSVANGDAGLVLAGSDQFVSKPYGLLLQTDTDSGCTAAIDCLLYPGGVRAGDAFSLRIKAVAWQSDGEALTAAALADNLVTTNFQLGNIDLASQVMAPAGGGNGNLGSASYSHVLGDQTSVSHSIFEVGVFQLTATPVPGSYFGETVSGGTSGLVGRFAPAALAVSGEAALKSCDLLSYQGEPVPYATAPALTVTGLNRLGSATVNYELGDFWRLPRPLPAWQAMPDARAIDTRVQLGNQAEVVTDLAGAATDPNANGARIFTMAALDASRVMTLTYTLASSTPTVADLPFTIRQHYEAGKLTDPDGACYLVSGACGAYNLGVVDSEVRLGRLHIGNAHGSELQPLDLQLRLESWQGGAPGSFQLEAGDACTATLLGRPELGTYTGNLKDGDTTPSLATPPLTSGQGLLNLSAPGNDGSVLAGFPTVIGCGGINIDGTVNVKDCLPDWLWYDWSGNGREQPRGLASFGIYKGATPLIFRRELYR